MSTSKVKHYVDKTNTQNSKFILITSDPNTFSII